MKKIDLEQGSQEWLSWRKTVITATDCPAILGSSPWSTAYKCWQKKKGFLEEKETNEAMERGKRLEPEARAQFCERYGITMNPMVVESSEFDFLGASLDGISSLGNHILEIKCGGSVLHNQASNGIIPQYYLDQIQHQLLVTRAEKGYYYSYNGKDGICIEVLPEPNFEERFMPKAREFLRCIAFDESPSLQEGDYRNMVDEPLWRDYAIEYRKVCDQIKHLEEMKEKYRKEILKLCREGNCIGNGIKVMKTLMKGRIAYDEIPEIRNVDLEKYRKNSITIWKILT
jgi:putative phage-type endonuclease